jgi:flagellar biogenesis protein FliO
MVIKTLLSLGAVLALMLGLAFLLKKYVYRTGTAPTDRVQVDLLGQRSFGPRRSVYVLRVLDRVLVVGMSEHGMHPLAELPAQDGEVAAVPDDTTVPEGRVEGQGAVQGLFSGQLARAMEAFGRTPPRRSARKTAPGGGAKR